MVGPPSSLAVASRDAFVHHRPLYRTTRTTPDASAARSCFACRVDRARSLALTLITRARTRFTLVLFARDGNDDIVGYPEGAPPEVLADVERIAPLVRVTFLKGVSHSVRVIGFVGAYTEVTLLRRDQDCVLCMGEGKTFLTVASALLD
jgi:hypothetical protein